MNQLTTSTKSFVAATFIAGGAVMAYSVGGLAGAFTPMLGILCVFGAVLHILKVEGATNRSHYTLSFLVYGFTLIQFGVPQAILVVIVSNIAEWIWNRQTWYIQLFNIGCYVLGIAAAGAISFAINPLRDTTSGLAILAIVSATVAFTFINHLLVGIIVWLARRENFKQSGIFSPVPVLVDLTMMSVGASLSIVWSYNAYALLIFLIPAYPFYLALKIPALERKSEIDMKTGLFNHHYFMTQFAGELQRANRYDRPLSIIIADLDLLRNINNTYGHLAGDDVLRGVADILKRTVREYDIVARFGGEEFAILMPEAEIETAIERAEFIRKEIEATGFVVPTSVDPIKVTMSFGISKRENTLQAMEEIIHNADSALYRSKLNGRNTCLAFLDNNYVHATSGVVEQVPDLQEKPADQSVKLEAGDQPVYRAAFVSYFRKGRAEKPARSQPVVESVSKPEPPKQVERSAKPVPVRLLIGTMAVISMISLAISIPAVHETIAAYSMMDWFGFVTIVCIIGLTEWFSINLYVRNTSLSTSAVPILALILLFGPLGTLVASLVFAVVAALKFRSRTHRIVFNFSNHVIAGTAINVLTYGYGLIIPGWGNPVQELLLALAAAMILFIITTRLVSVGIGLDTGQSPYEVWNQQYRWIAPYYLGMGFIVFALMFGYQYAGLPGILATLAPMSLLRISEAQYIEHTRLVVNELRQKNHELELRSIEITELNEGLLETLSDMIDLRDPYVLGHSRNVSKYATDIARLMKLSDRQIEMIRKAGLLHDIGKLGMPSEILAKPGRLTSEEYEIIKGHAALGAELVIKSPSLRPLVPMIRHHHEHYDGRGYPDRIAGNQISIEARIIAVADALEAMTSNRPYRKALDQARVVKELLDHAGSQFDPLVAQTAITMLLSMHADETPVELPEAERQSSYTAELNIQPATV
jgi:diguanylate cyclase (GGDEF)-like protein/putative nucleotidyltransferase with HDIG domain